MTVLGVIPARGGSKGIVRKNLVPLAGKPLLTYTLEAALASRRLDRVIVSTDADEIASIAEEHGVEVPFRRPPELSTDEAPMVEVLQHALDWAIAGDLHPDAVVLLQPTSPLRRAEHIDAAIDLFRSGGGDTVVTVVEVPHPYNPSSVMTLQDGALSPFLDGSTAVRRQDKPPVYARNGPAVVVADPDLVRDGTLYGPRTLGLEMARLESIDIDDADDLLLAELLLAHHGAGG